MHILKIGKKQTFKRVDFLFLIVLTRPTLILMSNKIHLSGLKVELDRKNRVSGANIFYLGQVT